MKNSFLLVKSPESNIHSQDIIYGHKLKADSRKEQKNYLGGTL